MHVAVIGLVLLGIFVWALIVSRGFRITAGVIAVIGIVWFSIASDQAEKQKAADETAAQQASAKEKEKQAELWSRVPPTQVELRNPQLLQDKSPFSTDDFKFTGSIRNLSNQQLGGFEIDVTARDCTDKCEVVGHANQVVWVDVPPQQVRGVSGKISLANLPPLRGKFVPQFIVKRVYAGDLLDYWSASRN